MRLSTLAMIVLFCSMATLSYALSDGAKSYVDALRETSKNVPWQEGKAIAPALAEADTVSDKESFVFSVPIKYGNKIIHKNGFSFVLYKDDFLDKLDVKDLEHACSNGWYNHALNYFERDSKSYNNFKKIIPSLLDTKLISGYNAPALDNTNVKESVFDIPLRTKLGYSYDRKYRLILSDSDYESSERKKDFIMYCNSGWYREAIVCLKDSSKAKKSFAEMIPKIEAQILKIDPDASFSSSGPSRSRSSAPSYSAGSSKTYVKPYIKKDGTRVSGHYRRK